MTIYLDTCALNRLTDDLTQSRVRSEAFAVTAILDSVDQKQILWCASTALVSEINRNPDEAKRRRALALLPAAAKVTLPNRQTVNRAAQLEQQGFGDLDALHLALAEQETVDFFLTTDDRLIGRAAAQHLPPPPVVLNPVDWVRRRHTWQVPRP